MSEPGSSSEDPSPGSQAPPSATADPAIIMRYDANKKSMLIAFLLWLFVGGLGAHRFYLGDMQTAIGLLAMGVIGTLTAPLLVGYLLLIPWLIWWLVDGFFIPRHIRAYNNALIAQLTA